MGRECVGVGLEVCGGQTGSVGVRGRAGSTAPTHPTRGPGHRGLALQPPPPSAHGPLGPWELKPPFPGPVTEVPASSQEGVGCVTESCADAAQGHWGGGQVTEISLQSAL